MTGVALPTLILTGGPLDGTEFPLRMNSREVSIGSSGGSDVQVSLGNVDPLHAMLTFGAEGLTIADVGSGTGTFVNGEKVESEVVLQDGDRICLGPPGAKESAKLLVRLPGGAVAAASASAPAPPADAGAPSFIDVGVEPEPVLIGGDAAAAVTFSEEAPWPPPPSPPPPAAPPPPRPVAPAPAPAPTPPRPFVPTPEPEPPLAAEPLTAPPPDEPPPPPEIPRLVEEPPPAPPPAARRSRAAAAGRGGRAARRARKSSPRVLPIVGGLLVLLGLGAGGWWFFLRPTATPAGGGTAAARPAPPAGGEAAPAGQAQGAPPAPAPAGGGAAATGTHLEPDVALPGQSIQILGSLPTGPVTVTVAGEAAQVEDATAEAIRLIVPNISMPPGQTVQVVVKAGSRSLPPLDLVLGRLPMILKLEPAAGSIGDRVVITGRGFDPLTRGNTVTFGDAPALVLKASTTELTVAVPAPRTIGLPEAPVVVAARGRTSARDRMFSLQRPSSSSFVPRFFPAPVNEQPAEEYAFVSTELGPVLLLGGPAGSESTAARAATLSVKLNELVSRASTRRVDVELRGVAVAVVGEAGTLVSARPEDVAAYEKGWEQGARRGPRLSAATLTRHWAAILEDYFALFLYRERPLEVAALSPHGQVFIDIYAEAMRRPSGRGVSAGIVQPTPEAMEKALRLAALVPSAGPAREEIAVKGRWQGTIEDPDTGSRRFELRLGSEGQGLDGAIKTWRGSLELSAPVRDVSFKRGTLRFTTDLQGTAHHFEGTLHNTTISGSAMREGRPPAPFTLEFVE